MALPMPDIAVRPAAPFKGKATTNFGADAELADLSSDSVIVFDLSGSIKYWNPASERLYGWPAIGVIGCSIAGLSKNEGLHIGQWRWLFKEGSWEGQVRRRTPWGGHVTATVRQIMRCDAQGQPRDIVEYGRSTGMEGSRSSAPALEPNRQVAANWELDISRARRLLDAIGTTTGQASAPDSAQRTDWTDELLALTRIVDINAWAVHLVGAYAGRARMVGQSVGAFWPRGSRAILAEIIVAVATDSPRGATHMRRLESDGILRDPVVTAWRAEAQEQPDTVFVTVNGATDDDRSFWYLRASEDRYRKLIHHLPTALLQIDASCMGEVFGEIRASGVTDIGAYLDDHPELVDFANRAVHVTEANQRAVALFGAKAPADFLRPIGFLFAASPETARRVMVARFERRRNYTEVMKVRTFDGQTLDVQLSVTYPASPERLDVTLLSLEDVTERLRTERQLREVEANFTHAARVSTLGELAASIAHEVNQPLSAIVTNGETSLRWLAREEPNVAKVAQLTTRMVASARRASDIVRRIREMATGRAPKRVSLDLNDVVEEALVFVRHDLEAKSIELSLNCETGLSRIIGDRIQLQQVIVNLLVNSIQAISEGGGSRRRIELSTHGHSEGAVAFSIRDSGPGIASGNLDHVFDCFFTTKEAGMGIGLAIGQSIIMEHGGSISASNHPGGGAQFNVSLPAAEVS
jgi:two-component system, LuxR family, sensor kinase FixL